MSPWALFAGACVAIVFLPLVVLGFGYAIAKVGGGADTAAGRDEGEVGER
jgi:hypothetical protein